MKCVSLWFSLTFKKCLVKLSMFSYNFICLFCDCLLVSFAQFFFSCCRLIYSFLYFMDTNSLIVFVYIYLCPVCDFVVCFVSCKFCNLMLTKFINLFLVCFRLFCFKKSLPPSQRISICALQSLIFHSIEYKFCVWCEVEFETEFFING